MVNLHTELMVALYRDFALPQMSNVFANLKEQGVKNGEFFAGKFKGIPAIICGAGPSLEESLERLKQMEDRALIFGGGSALGPLSKHHIPLHFAAAIDPDPPSERFFNQTYFEVPLFYQNTVSSTLLSHHHGPKICMGESGCFELEKALVEDANLTFFNVGWNVSTFCVQLAVFLGCNPISLVGMDLCVYEEASYAAGVDGKDQRKNPIELFDREGKKVFTRPDFLMAKKWLEALAKNHPEITFINATQGGLELEGISDHPLEVPKQSWDLRGKLHHILSEAPELRFPVDKLPVLDNSLRKTGEILENLLQALKNGEKTILQEIALEEEFFFQKHLRPLWEVWKDLLQSEEIILKMENVEFEKKLQECLFYKEVTEKFCHARNS